MSDTVSVDVGGVRRAAGATVIRHPGAIDASGAANVPPGALKTSLEGTAFQLAFRMPAGTYDVTLAFVQTAECVVGRRVFNVVIGGRSLLQAYDVFQAAGKCSKARLETFTGVSISAAQSRPLSVVLRAVSGVATLSYVRIAQVGGNMCTPVTTDVHVNGDHLAHAVPGSYPSGDAPAYVDLKRKGYVDVWLDGRGSHTHFSYPNGTGKITSYRWTLASSGKVISTRPVFKHRFLLGSTPIRLAVQDDACSRDEAETTVTLSSNMQRGMYCYYYSSLPFLPQPAASLRRPMPKFAAIAQRTRLTFEKLPFASNARFFTRCQFFLQFSAVSSRQLQVFSVRVGKSGRALVYKDSELIIDSNTTASSGPLEVSTGLSAFELIFARGDTKRKPLTVFKVNGVVPRAVSHDQSTVMPILSGVDPPSGMLSGGARLKVVGSGLYLPLKVNFGRTVRYAQRNGASSNQVFVVSPPAPVQRMIPLTVETVSGTRSNPVDYEYSDICEDAKFSKEELRMSDGASVPLNRPAAVATWQDGSLYIGQLGGNVAVVSYDVDKLTVTSLCWSERLTDKRYKTASGELSERMILGLTFDPRDKQPQPYVSVNTLFWWRQNKIDRKNKRAWSNGAVVRFKPALPATRAINPRQCLQYDRTIVRNLPVSDGDHGVNEMVFTQGGDLLIAVGGNTNMGLPELKLGGRWETYFSGSIVIARLSRGATYNGNIPYRKAENMRIAQPVPGYTDVGLYATGVRNPFAMTMARDGSIYAVDMGPNCGFGNASSTCDQYDEAVEQHRDMVANFAGLVIVKRKAPSNCKYGPDREDKLLRIRAGAFYGHPNIQRARLTGRSGECAWVDPLRGRPPQQQTTPSNYEAPLSMVTSAKTGVLEYGGNAFCGQLRGDLILSQNTERSTWRARLNKENVVQGMPFEFLPKGGIRVVENVRGDLLFPKYNAPSGIFVSRMQRRGGVRVSAVNALPVRHGRAGGSLLTIGGWGFDPPDIRIRVGGEKCPVVKASATQVTCVMPKYKRGSVSKRVVVTQRRVTTVLEGAILYMSI